MRLKREQSDRGRINIRRKRDTECNAVARVPPTSRTHSIQQHADAQINSFVHLRLLTQRSHRSTPDALQSQKAERRRNHPARCAGKPTPTILSGIEFHVPINVLKLPPPEPLCFAPSVLKQPFNRALRDLGFFSRQQGIDHQCGYPTACIISHESRPTAISVPNTLKGFCHPRCVEISFSPQGH